MIDLIEIKNKAEYVQEYAKYDYDMEKIKDNHIDSLEVKKYSRFFDLLTGAVIVPDYLWNSGDSSRLKLLFEQYKERDGYKYIMHANEGVILRGAATYYYILANKGMYEHVSIEHLKKWKESYAEYFDIFLTEKLIINTELDKICVMGILDTVRDYFLNILNIYIYGTKNYDCVDSFLLLENEDKCLSEILDALRMTYIEFERLLLSDGLMQVDNTIFLDSIKKVDDIVDFHLEKNNYDCCLRSYRELDSFWELYVTTKYVDDSYIRTPLLIGVLQGGMEIPVFFSAMHENLEVGFIHMYGTFKERHQNNILTNTRLQYEGGYKACTLCDENILTGNTLYLASRLLDDFGCSVDEYIIIRRLGSNRISHLLSYNECVDIEFCRNELLGMLFQTKYSKIKEDTNIKGMFYNELFQFDLAKERIYEMLYVNGCYSEKSRVACYKNLEKALAEKIRT